MHTYVAMSCIIHPDVICGLSLSVRGTAKVKEALDVHILSKSHLCS